MELNRNQYFFAGVLILMIGLQLRMIGSFELSSDATAMLSEPPPPVIQQTTSRFSFASIQQPVLPRLGRKVVQPPEWLCWCLISVGGVLVLHSLAMAKPE